MDFAFAASDSGHGGADGTEGVKSDGTFPTHPGEKPSKVAHVKWIKKFKNDLIGIGYAAPLRGELPFEIKKLADRDLIPAPADPAAPGAASITIQNATIAHQNKLNKTEREARMDEMQNRLAARLATAMEIKAPLRLGRLKTKHQRKTTSGDLIPDSYDGIAMFREEERDANDGEVGEYDEKRYELAYEKLRDNRLADNCSPQTFSDRINLFNTYVNPYLEVPLAGARLSKYILSQLPDALAADVRSLRRELDAASELDDVTKVTAEAQKIIESSYRPSKPTPVDAGVALVAGVFNAGYQREVTLAADKATISTGLADEIKKIVAAAAGTSTSTTSTSGRAKKKAAKEAAAVAAAAAAATEDKKPKLRLGNRLPEGQRCSKGSCEFAHDLLKPGEPCYRDITWKGPLPPTVTERSRANIEKDREKEAQRLKVPYVPLPPPTGANLATGGALTLGAMLDQLGSTTLMADIDYGDDYDESGYDMLGSPASLLSPDSLQWSSSQVQMPSPDDEASSGNDLAPTELAFETPMAFARGAACAAGCACSLSDVCEDDGAGVGTAALMARAPMSPSIPATLQDAAVTTADSGDSTAAKAAPAQTPAETSVTSETCDAVGASTKGGVAAAAKPPASTKGGVASLRAAPPLVVPEQPSYLESFARVMLACSMTLVLGILVVALVHGSGGAHAGLALMLSSVCTRDGLARGLAIATTDTVCSSFVEPPSLDRLTLVSAVGAFVFIASMIAEWAGTLMLLRLLTRLGRGAIAVTNPRAVLRHLGMAVGISCTLFLILAMLGGASGEVQPVPAVVGAPLAQLAHRGTHWVPGAAGERMRQMVEEISISRLNVTATAPHFLDRHDVEALVYNVEGKTGLSALRNSTGALTIVDSGAAIDVATSAKHAVPGSVRPNSLAVKTANGEVVPPLKCDLVQTIRADDGTLFTEVLEGVLIMPDCAHNLLSAGKMASQRGVSLTIGAGADPSYFTFRDGKRAPVLNLGVMVLPGPSLNLTGAVYGAARGAAVKKHLERGIVHRRACHRHWATVKNWHRCTANVPVEWSQNVHDEPCDDCLRANSPDVPSDQHAPVVESPGDLLSYDIYALGISHVHGGQSKVLGIHDHKSGHNWVRLLRNETEGELLTAWREYHAYARSHKVEIRHVHTDNAKAFVGAKMRAFFRDEVKCRYTTIAPNNPRSNGVMERQWRTMGECTRSLLNAAKLPRTYAGYALMHAVAVNNTLPLKSDPETCALSIYAGSKPNAAHFRVFGCVVYCKLYDRITKMSNQAVRCIHLGCAPNQTGYVCYEPETKRVYVSAHCRFVETSCPGLTLNRDGYEAIVPGFSDEYDDAAPRPEETPLIPGEESSVLDGCQPPPLVTEDLGPPSTTDENTDDAPAEAPDSPTAGPQAGWQPPAPARSALQRAGRFRSSNNPYAPRRSANVVTSLLALATSAFAALKPGGEAFGNSILGFNDSSHDSYCIYLCSGPPREGDFSSWVSELSAAKTYVINIDTLRGGYAHDLSAPTVAKRLIQLAKDPRCVGVLAAIPCGTWSPARFVQPGPAPLRSQAFPSGIPNADGSLPSAVQRANLVASHTIQIAEACAAHGGHFIFENPVGRDRESQFAIAGREDHASLWTLPAMRTFAAKHQAIAVHFDQCRTGAATMKTTQLLCSRSVEPAVRDQLGHLVCNHPAGTHQSIVGGSMTASGEYLTKPAERFTSDLNKRLAMAMLTPKSRSEGWLACMSSHVEPFTSARVSPVSHTATYATIAAHVDEADADSLLQGIAALFHELPEEDVAWGESVLAEIAPFLEHTSPTTIDLLESSAAWAVAKIKKGDADNPTYKQAMAGPERDKWIAACDEEMASFERHQVCQEVPEDSLPSWDPVRKRASELVDMLWILKVKYNELLERVRFRARATVRGDQETAVDKKQGLSPAETFAPTIRHSTLKLLIAAATVRAASKSVSHHHASAEHHVMRYRGFDVPTAFLRGAAPAERNRYVLPPAGYQKFDRRGVRIVWHVTGNVYGTTTAPRVFNQTLHSFLVSSEQLNMTQSDIDPCYYYKIYPDDTRLDLVLYVDDGFCADDAGPLADADLAKLTAAFEVKVVENPKQFLGMDVTVHSPTRVTLNSESYIVSMADKYLPDWRSKPLLSVPATGRLLKAYDVAHARAQPVDPALISRYMSKVGALVYTSPCVRVDTCATIGRLSRALSFATAEMESCCDECMLYLAQTAHLGVTFDGHARDAGALICECDSDWAVGHSTTGWAAFLAGAAVSYSSKRQACIAMSSTDYSS